MSSKQIKHAYLEELSSLSVGVVGLSSDVKGMMSRSGKEGRTFIGDEASGSMSICNVPPYIFSLFFN